MQKLRKNSRLKNYDYKNNGAYFVTICTNFKQNSINRNRERILKRELLDLEKRFSGTKIDWYAIMKNHVHMIIFLDNSTAGLPRIIQAFKSITNLKIREEGYKHIFWQRNYYEHVIRNESALMKIREYIQNNPLADRLKTEEIYNEVEPQRSQRDPIGRSSKGVLCDLRDKIDHYRHISNKLDHYKRRSGRACSA